MMMRLAFCLRECRRLFRRACKEERAAPPLRASLCVLLRHDLAVLVLLKFIASVIPTIEYDYTMDVDMGLCSPEP